MHSTVNVLNATELVHLKMITVLNFVYVYYTARKIKLNLKN